MNREELEAELKSAMQNAFPAAYRDFKVSMVQESGRGPDCLVDCTIEFLFNASHLPPFDAESIQSVINSEESYQEGNIVIFSGNYKGKKLTLKLVPQS